MNDPFFIKPNKRKQNNAFSDGVCFSLESCSLSRTRLKGKNLINQHQESHHNQSLSKEEVLNRTRDHHKPKKVHKKEADQAQRNKKNPKMKSSIMELMLPQRKINLKLQVMKKWRYVTQKFIFPHNFIGRCLCRRNS